MTVDFIFPDSLNLEDESLKDMVSDVNAFVAELPDDATLLHLRLPDDIIFNDATNNRIRWYMKGIREFLSVARPNIVTLCNQFDMTANSENFISADFDVPDELSKDTLLSLCYELLSVVDESDTTIDTSVSEIILPN